VLVGVRKKENGASFPSQFHFLRRFRKLAFGPKSASLATLPNTTRTFAGRCSKDAFHVKVVAGLRCFAYAFSCSDLQCTISLIA
jgi:hypothetical protein